MSTTPTPDARGWPFELLIGLRYIRAGRRSRRNGFISFIALLSMIGIALGVAALIVVISVMNGFQKEVRDRMLSVVPHIQVLAADGGALPDNWPQLQRQLARQPDVTGVAPLVSGQALVADGSNLTGVLAWGIDPQQERAVSQLPSHLVAGNLDSLRAGSFDAALGRELALQLGVGLGDHITLVVPSGTLTPAGMMPRLRTLTVTAVFNAGHYEYDSGLLLLNLDDAALLFGSAGPTALRVQTDDATAAPLIAERLQRALPSQLLAQPWTAQNRTWFDAVVIEKRMMFIILLMIVAVAAFNLVSTLVMTVTDKQADIAILRTQGASPRSIMAIFMIQGAVSGVLGVLGGLALGLLISVNVDTIVSALERLLHTEFLPRSIYLIHRMPSDPRVADIATITLLALLLSLLATLYPSWRAARIDPAQALRYE